MPEFFAPLVAAALTVAPGTYAPSESVTLPGRPALQVSSSAAFAPAHVPDAWVRVLVLNESTRAAALGAGTEADSRAVLDVVNKTYLGGSLPVNLQMVLVGQVTFSGAMPFTWTTSASGVNTGSLLSNFDAWRRANIASLPAHDLALLFTALDFEGSTVGLAGVGTFGDPQGASAIHQLTFANAEYHGEIVAHEVGHTLGMSHDSSGNACAASGFVMEAVSCSNCGSFATAFSTCSAASFTALLNNKPGARALLRPTLSSTGVSPRCGDGLVEPGEACDCGVWCAADPCCNGATCSLSAGATCSEGQRCCDTTCAPKANGAVCRAAKNACDMAETCDGVRAECSDDQFVAPGSACNDGITANGGTCLDGACHSIDAQCTTLESLYGIGPYQRCTAFPTTCSTLLCGVGSPTACTSFLDGASAVVPVDNGASCGAGKLCSGGACVAATSLGDQCPQDALKTLPGLCGCGVPDADADGDGTVDCFDLCPTSRTRIAPPCAPSPVPAFGAHGVSVLAVSLLTLALARLRRSAAASDRNARPS